MHKKEGKLKYEWLKEWKNEKRKKPFIIIKRKFYKSIIELYLKLLYINLYMQLYINLYI